MLELGGTLYRMPNFEELVDSAIKKMQITEELDKQFEATRKLREDMELIKEWVIGMSKIP